MNKAKKVLSILLSTVMSLSLFSTSALAKVYNTEDPNPDSPIGLNKAGTTIIGTYKYDGGGGAITMDRLMSASKTLGNNPNTMYYYRAGAPTVKGWYETISNPTMDPTKRLTVGTDIKSTFDISYDNWDTKVLENIAWSDSVNIEATLLTNGMFNSTAKTLEVSPIGIYTFASDTSLENDAFKVLGELKIGDAFKVVAGVVTKLTGGGGGGLTDTELAKAKLESKIEVAQIIYDNANYPENPDIEKLRNLLIAINIAREELATKLDVAGYNLAAANLSNAMKIFSTPVGYFAILVDSAIQNGTVTADKSVAVSGDVITLTVTPTSGYQLKAGSLKANDEVITGTTFTMPEANVTITAEFEKVGEVVLSSIEVTTLPSKTQYIIGDTLDITGIVVTGTYSDGSTKVETVTATDVTGFDSSTAGTKTLTVTVDGKTATFTVTVLKEGTPVFTTDPANTTDIAYTASGSSVKVTLSTTLEDAKIYYTTNGDTPTADSTEYAGEFIVKQQSSNAETYEVKAIAINEDVSSSVAIRTISFAAEIVDEVVLSSIEVTTLPSKTEYQIGETLDITGMIVTGTYSDGSTKVETVTATDVTGFDSSTAGTKTLTVTVDGKTTTFTVTVAEIVDTKVTVTFSADGADGTVEAHVYKNGAEEVITVSPAKIDANSKVVFLAKPDISSVLNTWNNNDTQKEITYTIESMITDTEVTANFIAKDITSIETAITDAKVYQTQLSDGTIIIGVSEETVEQGQQFVLQVESDALTTGIALAEKLITENDIVKIETIKQIADATTALNSITTEFKNAIKEGTKPLVTKNLKATVVSAVYGNTVAGEVYKSVYNSVSGAVYTDDEVKIQFTVKDGDGFVFGDVKVDGTSTQLPQEGNEAPTITELTGATVTILNNSWSVSIPSADLVDVENKYVVVSFTIQKDTDTRITNRMQIFIKLETDTTSK